MASIVRGPRIDHEEVRPWSLDEAATFLAAASEHRLSALFAVGVAVGPAEAVSFIGPFVGRR